MMRVIQATLLAVTCVMGPACAGASDSTNLARSGRYALSYFGQTLGQETFSIQRTDTGYLVEATLTKTTGGQPRARSVYVLDDQRQFVSGTFEPLDGGLSATYAREGDQLIATASDGSTQTITLAPDDLVAGPHYVTDFFLLDPLDIEVGTKIERTCHTFGFKDWRVYPVELDIRRDKDKRISSTDGRISTKLYRCKIDDGTKTYKTGSWIDANGVSHRISISAPIGTANVRLKEVQSSTTPTDLRTEAATAGG